MGGLGNMAVAYYGYSLSLWRIEQGHNPVYLRFMSVGQNYISYPIRFKTVREECKSYGCSGLLPVPVYTYEQKGELVQPQVMASESNPI